MRRLPLLLALLLPAAGLAADAPVPPEAATEGDLRDHAAALERFRARAAEIEADARQQLRAARQQQVAALQRTYAGRLQALATTERARRSEAIAKLEGFLARYDDLRFTSDVRLRLAELRFQEAEDAWLAATDAYEKALAAAGGDLEKLAELEAKGSPRIELSQVVDLLDDIVRVNRGLPRSRQYPLLDVAWYMLAFAYGNENSSLYDRQRARAIFSELIAGRPDSDYADAAHLMLGNYAFEDNDYERAIPEFQAVVARGPDRLHYLEAVYQLAWSRYKLDAYDEAMAGFVEILDRSEEMRRTRGRPSEFAPDAVAYLALSISDRADAAGVSPLTEANRFFARVGTHKPWRWDVLKELAESLVRYARPSEAVEVYTALQADPDFRYRPENPDFQDQVVKLLSRGFDADLAAAGQARLEMTERYGENSAWWNANRSNPDAQSRARRYIEGYLLEVATELKVRAQESGEPAAFSIAADKYREYLEKFPIADDWFPNQFQMADALYRAHRYEEAARTFASLVENARFHPYGDASLYMLLRAREALLRERVGPPDQRAQRAVPERSYVTESGREILVYGLLEDQKAFVQVADEVVAHAFGEPVDGIDLRPVVEAERVKLMYLPAQILFYANRFEEARPRLQTIVKQYPHTDEAAFAANLFLNTYIAEGDNDAIRRWSREFAAMQLGRGTGAVALTDFKDTYEKASYQIGFEAAERGDHEAAAKAFLAFVQEFPKSRNVPEAMLSAGAAYEKLGRVGEANALYERFLERFPEHPRARFYYFPIASNYEATFELEKAVTYYEAFVRRYPDDSQAANAQYMVAFLQEGLGRHAESARSYEAYAQRFPDTPDREDVHFRAGARYEAVDPEAALRFYQRYLDTYGIANPDHALLAQARIAELQATLGRQRAAESARDALVALFDRIVAAGVNPGPEGRDLAAGAAFRAVQARYDAIAAKQLTRNEVKDSKLLLEELPRLVAELDAEANALMHKYASFEWSTAALYLQGAARAAYARLGFKMEPPPGLDEDQQAAYWELLEETLFVEMGKVEASAASAFERVLQLAAETRRHSTWVDRARLGLNDIDPSRWPDVKEPIRGKVEAVQPVVLRPILPAAPAGTSPAAEGGTP